MAGAAAESGGTPVLEEALEWYDKAVSLEGEPGAGDLRRFGDIWSNRGLVLGALGGESRGAEALAGYEHAAAVYGGAEGVGFSSPLAEAALYTNWGAMLAGRTRHSEAADVLQKAVTLRPDDASAFLRLATELKATGSHAEELEAYDSALAVLAEGPLVRQLVCL